MNNRIEELICQATTVEDTYPAGCNGYPTPVSYFNKEKFAELIVKEYANLCENSGYEFGIIFSSMGKTHFGVKE